MKRILLFAFTGILFTSCQKGVDWSVPSLLNPIATQGALLLKTVAITGTDTVTTTFSYDANKRLASERVQGKNGGIPYDNYKRYDRAMNGRITRVVEKQNVFGVFTDSVYTNVFYPNDTTYSFTHAITVANIFGILVTDSTAAKFDSTGKITRADNFTSSPLFPGAPRQTWRRNFSYDILGNLADHKYYSDSAMTGNLSLTTTFLYAFDTKSGSLINSIGGAFLMKRYETGSKNNLTRLTINDAVNPANSTTINTVYTYGVANKPLTGTATRTPQNVVTTTTYTYQ